MEAGTQPRDQKSSAQQRRKKMRPSKIKLGLAVLGLGTALAALPAYAQTSGPPRAHSEVQTSGQRTGSLSNEESRAPGGNTYAFGGQGQPQGAGYHYPVGRSANDGGANYGSQATAHTEAPTGGQRSGSASNEQAQTSSPHGDLYAFGGQGQPPGAGYHYPIGRSANDGGMNYGTETSR
jgi:hypothetical protein